MGPNEQRVNDALEAVRKAGISVSMNVMTCCRSCITPEDLGIESEEMPHVYHYGGQGFELEWYKDLPVTVEEEEQYCRCEDEEWEWDDEKAEEVLVHEGYTCSDCENPQDEPYRRRRPANSIYFNHSDLSTAQTLAAAFAAQGLDVDWDGTEDRAVALNFEW